MWLQLSSAFELMSVWARASAETFRAADPWMGRKASNEAKVEFESPADLH
jgi:hypothetical protein